MLAEQAHEESTNTSLRVRRAHESSAAKGKMHTGGNRQYDYTRGGEVVPEEAEVIRECVRRVLAGESLRRIATDLNDRGVRGGAGARGGAGVPSLPPAAGINRLTSALMHDD